MLDKMPAGPYKDHDMMLIVNKSYCFNEPHYYYVKQLQYTYARLATICKMSKLDCSKQILSFPDSTLP